MAKKVDLSVIIVSFNTRDLLRKLLISLKQSRLSPYTLETIVVDNASTDGSKDLVKRTFPEVKLIAHDRNLGFAAANNKGLRQARGQYLLLLNSDTQVEPDTLKTMIDFMETNHDFAAATCRVELPDGRLDPASHRGIPTPWAAFTYFTKLERLLPKSRLFGRYHQDWKNLQAVHEVEVISGAFFLVRRQVIEKVGLFDEGYFMYGEDVDWCMRIRKAGYKIAFVPSTKIAHVKGQSGRAKETGDMRDQNESKKLSNHYFWETMKLFYQKHYRQRYPRILMWLVFRVINWQIRRTQSS